MLATLNYLMTLSPEQLKEAVSSMSKEQKNLLISSMCGAVGKMSRAIVEGKEVIWETGELPTFEIPDRTMQ